MAASRTSLTPVTQRRRDVTDRSETEHRILEAALRTLGQNEPGGLTMRDVSTVAGLGRATVYRYFPNKDDLLVALAGYEHDRFQEGLDHAMSKAREGDEARTLVTYLFDYLRDHPALEHFIESESGFVLGYLREHQISFRETSQRALGRALSDSWLVQSGQMTSNDLIDLLLRMLLSTVLLPPTNPRAARRALHAATAMLVAADPAAIPPI